MANLFILLIYQPFLNVLVFFYWMVGLVTNGRPDMGIAVIFLTIFIRILLFPMSIQEEKSEADRRAFALKMHELEEMFATDHIRRDKEKKLLMKGSRTLVWGELFSLFVQVMISLMLWKMFDTGLEGADLHLLYSFMPKIELPFNLVFLGKYDLSHTNNFLNIMQSVMIFLVETASVLASPYPASRGEVVRMQFILPVVSFLIFMYLPAGKKLFVITTLIISFILICYKVIRRKFNYYVETKTAQTEVVTEEKVVVEVKA